MQSTLRLSALLATADGLALSTGSKKPAVAGLLESAKNMLRNGATPAVIEFADQTLLEINNVVIPAIKNESKNDQEFIYALHRRYEELVFAQLSEDNKAVHALDLEETRLSGEHQQCRREEHYCNCYGQDPDFPGEDYSHCEGKRKCEKDLYRLWEIWVEEEETLRGIHDTISGHFCPPGTNGTLHTFRTQSIPWMESYMAQKIVVDQAEAAYDLRYPDCITRHQDLDMKSDHCNDLQTELQSAACAHEAEIVRVLERYYEAYAQAHSAYTCAQEEVMELERDRYREWKTLQVVDCLLKRIRDQNGVPCDTEEGVTEEVGICEQLHALDPCSLEAQFTDHPNYEQGITAPVYDPADDLDIPRYDPADASTSREGASILCIHYPAPEPHAPFCPSRDRVEGACRPVVQPTPCNADWDAQEMAISEVLPGFPLAPFSASNPGCNAYPACSPCPDVVVPQPYELDTCPGYTIDGCSNSNEDLPLTFVRDVGGLADVRCCSIDGSQCASQDLPGGVDYPTPNGGMHHGCHFQVTYLQAMDVCHAAGMRICSLSEIDSCCGTGCWHNHNKIWVNTLDDGVTMTLDERLAQAEHSDVRSNSETEGQTNTVEAADAEQLD